MGDKKAIRQVAAEYEEVYGVKPNLDSRGTFEDLNKTRLSVYNQDPQNKRAWAMMFYTYYMMQDSTRLGKLDNGRYPGFKADTFKDMMRKNDRRGISKLAFTLWDKSVKKS